MSNDEWFVTMPKLGETVTEGELTNWLKQVGDVVEFDDPLFEVSTDKVDSEIPSPYDGVIAEILVNAGETVPVGTQLVRIVPPGGVVRKRPWRTDCRRRRTIWPPPADRRSATRRRRRWADPRAPPTRSPASVRPRTSSTTSPCRSWARPSPRAPSVPG